MSTVYNPQWNRMMEVDTLLMQRLSSDNFHPSHTGGGCMAWERPTDDGGYVWITDGSGTELGTWASRYEHTWIVGRYNADGDYICVDGLTLEQALEVGDKQRAPNAEEQTTLSGLDYRLD